MAIKTFKITGDKELIRTLKRIEEKNHVVIASALTLEAEKIMGDSKENFVPVDTGILKSAGIAGKNEHVKKPVVTIRGVSVTMGYGGAASAYALSVHENPRTGKTGGVSPKGKKYKSFSTVGQWKYLETPLMNAIPEFLVNVAARVRLSLGKL